MRYSEDHKAKTHQRIIDEAARLFRRDGIGATGLQPLMKTLGLTHGGFYAHFKSKDQLVETALAHTAEQLKASTDEIFANDAPLPTFIRRYLSSAHCANPGDGCPLPTVDELLLRVEEQGSDSNPRTAPSASAMAQAQLGSTSGVRTPFEPHSNRSSSLHSHPKEGFERFDGFSGGATHTQSQDAGAAEELPWDSFLEEGSADDADAD